MRNYLAEDGPELSLPEARRGCKGDNTSRTYQWEHLTCRQWNSRSCRRQTLHWLRSDLCVALRNHKSHTTLTLRGYCFGDGYRDEGNQNLQWNSWYILPTQCHKALLQLAHEVPLAAHLGSGLIQPERSKVQGVESFPTPTTKKQVRCFLGMTGYYRMFIPDYASIAALLTDLRKNSAPNQVVWTDRCEGSFQNLKSLLCREPVLRSPDFTKEFILQTDASDVGVGAVPSLLDEEGADHPVAYYSMKLLAREQKHATIEK